MGILDLNDDFLAEVGLADMRPELRKPFLQHVYNTLELRVGVALSDGMSDEQLEEYEAIIDGRLEVIESWITQHSPDFAHDPIYTRIQSATSADEAVLKREYASTKWLEVNRPDYQDVVRAQIGDIRDEILKHKDKILEDASIVA